jgi:hypothetical protein
VSEAISRAVDDSTLGFGAYTGVTDRPGCSLDPAL